MSRNGKIGLIVDKREVVNGLVHLSVRMLNSTMVQPSTNELPIILNTLAGSDYLNPKSQIGFTYMFPFRLSVGHGFPYRHTFQFEKQGLLTLA